MARTVVPVSTIAVNTSTVDPTATALDATNSHYVDPGGSPLEELMLRITNTTASTKTVTVLKGDDPPADAAGQGDLVVSLTAGDVTPQVKWVGPLTSARFIQNDGTLNLDVAAAMTGDITVFHMPRTA